MISRYEQARYAAALGVNPTAHRDLVIQLLQGGKTGAELIDQAAWRGVFIQLPSPSRRRAVRETRRRRGLGR